MLNKTLPLDTEWIKLIFIVSEVPLKLCPPPLSRSGNQYHCRAAPSPIPRNSDASDQEFKEDVDKVISC